MKTQNQWLFEVPFASEVTHYTNTYFNYDPLDQEDWEQSLRFSARQPIFRETVSGFSRYSNAIPSHERAKINQTAQLIVQSHNSGRKPIRTVQLVGHADRDRQRGQQFERKISGDRALAVQQALIRAINNRSISSRISWQSVPAGASQLLVKNPTTEQQRSRNRRVGLFLTTGSSNTRLNRIPWTSAALGIALQKVENPRCLGTASPGFRSRLSQIRDCNGTCGGAVKEHFKILFHVDAVEIPRPQPFQPPTVSVNLEVLTASGKSKFSKQVSDANPIYQGAGLPLKTNFGQDFIVLLEPGDKLQINLQLNDPSSGVKVIYSDIINIVKIFCS